MRNDRSGVHEPPSRAKTIASDTPGSQTVDYLTVSQIAVSAITPTG
jgi:hypothetical protein